MAFLPLKTDEDMLSCLTFHKQINYGICFKQQFFLTKHPKKISKIKWFGGTHIF